MRVVIAGGHGQIALRLTKLLSGDGHEVVGLVRNPDHEADIAAGAGPGSGNARKDTVDRGAAVLFADAAEQAGVRRHLQVSSMGADRADSLTDNETFTIYLKAKWA